LEVIDTWFNQYGYYLLFGVLFLDYVAVFFPGQTVLIYSGYLSYNDIIHWFPAILLALIGTIGGLTVTYTIGYTAGVPFVQRCGKWIFLDEHKMQRMYRWFEKHGKVFLMISCFLPGIRQFTGYFAGIVQLPFRTFAIFTFTSALLWVGCCFLLGRLFAPWLYLLFTIMERYGWIVLVCLCGALLLYFTLRKYKISAVKRTRGS